MQKWGLTEQPPLLRYYIYNEMQKWGLALWWATPLFLVRATPTFALLYIQRNAKMGVDWATPTFALLYIQRNAKMGVDWATPTFALLYIQRNAKMGVDVLMSDLEPPPLLRYYIYNEMQKWGLALWWATPLFLVRATPIFALLYIQWNAKVGVGARWATPLFLVRATPTFALLYIQWNAKVGVGAH